MLFCLCKEHPLGRVWERNMRQRALNPRVHGTGLPGSENQLPHTRVWQPGRCLNQQTQNCRLARHDSGAALSGHVCCSAVLRKISLYPRPGNQTNAMQDPRGKTVAGPVGEKLRAAWVN